MIIIKNAVQPDIPVAVPGNCGNNCGYCCVY